MKPGGDNRGMTHACIRGRARGVMAVVLAGVWLLLAAAMPALAADDQPYIRFPKERYQLFVFGDKMATGLLAGLWRVLKNNPKFVARGRFNAGSGLVRVKYYDWQSAIARVLESRPVDIAVIMMGVNDARDIFVRGQRIPFGSEEWKRIYASRVDALIDTLKNNDVAVYWVGLPPVRDPRLDAAVRQINDIIRERAQANGIRFIDIRPHFSGPDGRFVENGPDVSGRITRLRARNGIHFIKAGNTRLAKIVADAIFADVKRAEEAPAAAPGLTAVAPGTDKPFVGRAAPDGTPLYEPTTALPGVDEVYLAKHLGRVDSATRNVLAVLRNSVAPGSVGEKLFKAGEWPDVPPQHVENFTAPLVAKKAVKKAAASQ